MPEGRAVRPHNSKQMQRICLESLSFYDRLKASLSRGAFSLYIRPKITYNTAQKVKNSHFS